MILTLSRTYVARKGAPAVDRVDTRIFHERFFSACMDCSFCFDSCCQYGATVEAPMVEAIRQRADELEPYVGVPCEQWFEDGFQPDADYPDGRHTRTRVVDGSCVFLNRTGRGCLLHRFALERGLQVQSIKPMACNMFPVHCEEGVLIPPYEVQDGTLVCRGAGPTLYRSARNDLLYYFGPELVAELDTLEAAQAKPTPAEPNLHSFPLPLIPTS
jgi:Fe-S-cluster containining protein